MKRFRKLAPYFLMITITCFILVFFFGRWLFDPIPSREQICHDLESNIRYSTCLNKGSTLELLSEAFEPGITTRLQVKQAIGDYFERELELNSRLTEYYFIDQARFRQVVPFVIWSGYIFVYDENGILLYIEYLD